MVVESEGSVGKAYLADKVFSRRPGVVGSPGGRYLFPAAEQRQKIVHLIFAAAVYPQHLGGSFLYAGFQIEFQPVVLKSLSLIGAAEGLEIIYHRERRKVFSKLLMREAEAAVL